MISVSDIESEFQSKGTMRGGVLLLPPSVAMEFVSKCREAGIKILGLDGFYISRGITQPLMEQSIDFSGEQNDDCWGKAEAFISKRASSNVFFEVVADEYGKRVES